MIPIEFEKADVYLLRACITNFISELGMELQDDHRDMELQRRHKKACELKRKIEAAIDGSN